MALRGTAVGIFIIPIVFSFVYGGAVLSVALGGVDRTGMVFSGAQSDSLEFVDVKSEYQVAERITAKVSVSDPAYDCGDLYVTLYDVSSPQKKAVTQSAFFEQCYGISGDLPLNEAFSEQLDVAGTYQVEAQLFDEQGDKFLTASKKFTVR